VLKRETTIKRPFLFFEFSLIFGFAAIFLTPLLLLLVPDVFFGTAVFEGGQARHVPLFKSTYSYLVQNNRNLDANRFAFGANIVLGVYFFQLVAALMSPFFENPKHPSAVNLTRQNVNGFIVLAVLCIAYLFFPEAAHTEESFFRHLMFATNKRFFIYACLSFPSCILLYGTSEKYLRPSK
jgi:hypothetical protein